MFEALVTHFLISSESFISAVRSREALALTTESTTRDSRAYAPQIIINIL